MKRGLVALLLLPLLCAAAVPWVVGGRAEVHYKRLLTDLQGQGFQVAESRYRRGWLSSEAESVLLPGADGWRLIATSHIEHGPFPWSDLQQWQLKPLAARSTTRLSVTPDGGEPQPLPTLLLSRTDLDGATEVRLRSEREFFAQDAEHSWLAQGLEGELHFDRGGRKLRGELRLPMLAMLEQDRPLLRLRGLTATAESERGASGLRLGRGSLILEEGSVAPPELDGRLRILGLDAQASSGAEGEMVWASATYRARELEAGGERFAAPELRLRTDGLSAPLLARIDRDLRALAAISPQQGVDLLIHMAALVGNLARLLESGPQFSLERLYLETPEGNVEGRLEMTLSGLTPLDMMNPQRWIEGLDGSGELAMPEALLRRLLAARLSRELRQELEGDPALDASGSGDQWIIDEAQRRIDQLVRQELFLRQGGRLHTRMHISAGLLSINGKSIPLQLLGQLSG